MPQVLTEYEIEDPCIGRVLKNKLGKPTIQLLEGCITCDEAVVTKFIAPTSESGVEEGDYVRIIQEVTDTKPSIPWKGVLFVSCEKLQPEEVLDWDEATAFQGYSYGGSVGKLYAKVPRHLCSHGVSLEGLKSKEVEFPPTRFEMVGDKVRFFISLEDGREISGNLCLDLNAWPLSWRKVPGWEGAYRKWLIGQRAGSRTTIRA